jgi:hypothetical protein
MNKTFNAFFSTKYQLYPERAALSGKYLSPAAMGLLMERELRCSYRQTMKRH